MQLAMKRKTELAASEVGSMAGRLEAINPLSVLARGYSLTSKVEDGLLVTTSESLQVGDVIETRLSKGKVTSEITDVRPADS